MEKGTATIAAIASAIIGLAIVAVLVSQNAQTSTVLTSAGTAFGTVIQAAVSPVTGGGATGTLGNLLTSSGVGNYGATGGTRGL